MYGPLEQQVIRLLRETPEPAVSLAWVHRELAARGESGTATPDLLEERLRRRPDAFLVLRSPGACLDNAVPQGVRRDYEEALARAGIDSGPRVVLIADPAPGIDDAAPDPATGSAAVAFQLRVSLAACCRTLAGDEDAEPLLVEVVQRGLALIRALPQVQRPAPGDSVNAADRPAPEPGQGAAGGRQPD